MKTSTFKRSPGSKAISFLLFAMMVILSSTGYSQSCANYNVTRNTGITYSSIAATGSSVSSWRGQVANLNDDNRSNAIPIGFDFWYLGTRYTTVNVGINGFIDFSTSSYDGNWPNGDPSSQPAGYATCSGNISYRENGAALYNIPCGNGVAPNSYDGTYWAVAPMYCDLNCIVSNSANIKYKTTGSTPNKILTIEYINMDDKTGSGSDYNFQVKLYESTGVIKFIYGTMTTTAMIPPPYSCGINGNILTNPPAASEILTQQADNSSSFGSTIPGMHFATPTSNSRITFTPPVPADPIGSLSFTAVTTSGMTLNWSDWAGNETGYVIYMSTNGTNYSYFTQVAANSTSYAASGLVSGTYWWKVYAVTEGCLSNPCTGSQATLASGTFTSVVTGNWSNPGTWDLGAVPTASDNVVIGNGTVVTLDGNYSCTNLTVGGGTSGTLLVGSSTTGLTLNILGDLKVKSAAVFKANNLFAATHTINLTGHITQNGTFNMRPVSTSVCNFVFNKNGNQTISGTGGTTTFSRMTLNMGTSASNILHITTTNFSAASNFLTLTNGTFKFSVPSNAVTLNAFTSTTTIPATCGIIMNSPNSVFYAHSTLNYQGSLTCTTGTVTIGDAADESLISDGADITLTSGTINIAGRLDRLNSIALTNLVISGGTLNVNTIGSTSVTSSPFTINTSGSVFNMTAGSIVVRNAGASNLGYTNINSSSYTFSGGTLQIGDASTPASQTMLITTDRPIAALVVNSTNSPAARLASALTVTGNVNVNATASLQCNNYNLTTGGTLTVDGTLTTGSNTVTFNGSAAQQIAGSNAAISMNNLTVSNTSGDVTLNNNGIVNVNGTLNFTSGRIILGTNDLVITSGNAITGYGSSSFVVTDGTASAGGALRINNLTAARDFPIGVSTTSYTPVLNFVNAGTADNYSARVFAGVLTGGTTGSPMTNNVVDRTWLINEEIPGGSSVDFRFQWTTSEEAPTFDRMDCAIRYYNSGTSSWDIPGSWGAATPNPAPTYYASRSIVSTFPSFSVHSGSASLPVELLSFHVTLNPSNQTDIVWETASEFNNNFFTVERSANNKTWMRIAQIKGAGNSSQVIQYSSIDANPKAGNNYYRIRQTDYNGNQTCSPIKHIYKLAQVSTQPISITNQGSQALRVQFNETVSGTATTYIYDAQGRQVKLVESENVEANQSILIDCSSMTKGVYYVMVRDNEQSFSAKFFKE